MKKTKRIIVLFLLAALSLSFFACETEETPKGPEEEEPLAVFVMGDVVDTFEAEYTYEKMEADLMELQALYPKLLHVASAGKSLDGREIYYADFGAADAPKKIMINAGIHGREYMTPLLLMKQLEYHLVNYTVKNEAGLSFEELFSDVSFRLVPMINPDGIAISQKGLEGIRSFVLRQGIEAIYSSDINRYNSYREEYKNIEEYLVHWKANARGVDLNRNFDIEYWEEMKTGVVQPSAQKYKGDAPCSEPESQALARITEELDGLVCAVSIHSQGEIIYWDCGQEGELRTKTRALCEAAQAVNGYLPYKEFINPDATYNDWCTLELGIPSINIETGVDKCPLPIEQFETIWNQNIGLWRALAELYN